MHPSRRHRDLAPERLRVGDQSGDCHPSLALDKANVKFGRRFQAIEALAKQRGIDVTTAGLEVLDGLWNEIKER